jgi:hypothetical protein
MRSQADDQAKANLTFVRLPENSRTQHQSIRKSRAASKYAALGNIEEIQGHHPAALAAIGKALANSQSSQIKFLAASTYVNAGGLPKFKSLRRASPRKRPASRRLTARSSKG